MKTQPTPLYAVDREGAFYAVIGWNDAINSKPVPILAPLGVFGQPRACYADVAYLAEAPIPDPIQRPASPADAQTEVINLPTVPVTRRTVAVPSDAQTEVIQRIPADRW